MSGVHRCLGKRSRQAGTYASDEEVLGARRRHGLTPGVNAQLYHDIDNRMTARKASSSHSAVRGEPVRQRVIDAAERLLRDGKAEFSMRDLAAEAGVSFATPFNQFGSKAAIMHSLAARRIETMAARYRERPTLPKAEDRVVLAIRIAAEGMLEEALINRAVMGWIGTAGPAPGAALTGSTALWLLALAPQDAAFSEESEGALRVLARRLAFGFRGTLSFWSAGELADEDLVESAIDVARTIVRGSTILSPT